ncbi:unnamed protein product [Trichogramma brassicae]|uniref:Bromodomain adjacent to zinc finger domain protein 2B n=2 Tax=Apocrita TaxID=7400 RepID=A0A6H5HZW0_9HYME|nr:unnamed protein product [Trichogramma brassicae]
MATASPKPTTQVSEVCPDTVIDIFTLSVCTPPSSVRSRFWRSPDWSKLRRMRAGPNLAMECSFMFSRVSYHTCASPTRNVRLTAKSISFLWYRAFRAIISSSLARKLTTLVSERETGTVDGRRYNLARSSVPGNDYRICFLLKKKKRREAVRMASDMLSVSSLSFCLLFKRDEEAVEGDAGDNRQAAGPGADDGRQLLHEREAPLHGQVEGRGAGLVAAEQGQREQRRRGPVVADDRHQPEAGERRFVTYVRPGGVSRRLQRRGSGLLLNETKEKRGKKLTIAWWSLVVAAKKKQTRPFELPPPALRRAQVDECHIIVQKKDPRAYSNIHICRSPPFSRGRGSETAWSSSCYTRRRNRAAEAGVGVKNRPRARHAATSRHDQSRNNSPRLSISTPSNCRRYIDTRYTRDSGNLSQRCSVTGNFRSLEQRRLIARHGVQPRVNDTKEDRVFWPICSRCCSFTCIHIIVDDDDYHLEGARAIFCRDFFERESAIKRMRECCCFNATSLRSRVNALCMCVCVMCCAVRIVIVQQRRGSSLPSPRRFARFLRNPPPRAAAAAAISSSAASRVEATDGAASPPLYAASAVFSAARTTIIRVSPRSAAALRLYYTRHSSSSSSSSSNGRASNNGSQQPQQLAEKSSCSRINCVKELRKLYTRGTGMEKESSAAGGGGGGSSSGGGGGGGGGGGVEATVTPGANSTPDHLQQDQANPLLDPTALFGAYWPRGAEGNGAAAAGNAAALAAAASVFGSMPGAYGLGAHQLPPSAYAILGRGAAAAAAAAPPPNPYAHLSGLGMNSAAWWTMATHLDYLARLQGAAGLGAFPPGAADGILPPYPPGLLNAPPPQQQQQSSHSTSHKSSKSKSSKSHKSSSSSSSAAAAAAAAAQQNSSSASHSSGMNNSTAAAMAASLGSQLQAAAAAAAASSAQQQQHHHHHNSSPVTSSSSSAAAAAAAAHSSSSGSHSTTTTSSSGGNQSNSHSSSNVLNDSSSILGGVRLPPDTEIIKYTSSIVGPKIPGTTNRGRKKTISLDSPSVSLHGPGSISLHAHHQSATSLAHNNNNNGSSRSSPALALDASKYNRSRHDSSSDYGNRGGGDRDSIDRVEVIKLPNHSTNGSVVPGVTPNYTSGNSSSGAAAAACDNSDAPLNLSLKPSATMSSGNSSTTISSNQPLSQLSNLSQSLLASDRSSRRKPGPKPRRVPQNSLPLSGGNSPLNPSLAQLFAAADSPQRCSGSGGEDSEPQSHQPPHKDRPRNLGRGVSKPKKNTVASLLAQSRALGIKPTPTIDPSAPLAHQVSLLRSNILAAQMHASSLALADERSAQRSLQEKIKISKLLEANLEDNNMEVNSESDGNTDHLSDTDDDDGVSHAKRRRYSHTEKDLQLPLERGWKRETLIRGISKNCTINGDVSYYSPCGKPFRNSMELAKFLEHQNSMDLTINNFSFSSKPLVGDFIQSTMGTELEIIKLSAFETARKLEELKAHSAMRDIRLNHQYERDKLAYAKKIAKEEQQRNKEQARLIKEQEKNERQEAVRREREMRNQQLLEARKKRQEEVEKLRMEEQQRKQQEREMKRQQAVMLKEQMYMQELTKQREILYTVELERERRRQHMTLIRALENRRKMEEREKKRLEARAERIAQKERRAEQRRLELELVEQIRKPVEDTELTDHKPLPQLKRLPGLKLAGKAFADIVMVFEFLHNFGETLGFDMDSLPSLKSLQAALLNDEEAEEELLSVMTHLLVCAIEDPGIPQPARHTTGSRSDEVLRIYLYANATGEIKALTGFCLERERDKRFADHHQNAPDSNPNHEKTSCSASSKNAQFYEHLHNNETWRMSERLRDKPFLALSPTHKAQMLAFLCNELLQNKAVLKQIETSLETVASLKKERFLLDTKIRKLRQLHSRKQRMEAVGVVINKSGDVSTISSANTSVNEQQQPQPTSNNNKTEEPTKSETNTPKEPSSTPTPEDQPPPHHDHDETTHDEEMSENESEGTQPEEEEDKNLSAEELGKKLDKWLKQSEEQLQKLNGSSKSIRAHVFGQDRFWRRYWELPCSGGVYVEAMESAEPEILDFQAELDLKYKDVEPPKEEISTKEEEPKESEEAKKEPVKEEEDVEMKEEIPPVESPKKKVTENCVSENHTDKESDDTEIKKETKEEESSEMEVDEKPKEGETEDKAAIVKSEDKVIDAVANGEKFNHVNNNSLPNGSAYDTVIEANWFSILPRETCDTPGSCTKQIFGVAESTELKIPIFPPPPSPGYDRCDSPAPLVLTQDEATQLEYLKIHGLPVAGEAKPVPKDLRYGWWRINDHDTFQELLEHLHSRGVREKELKRTTWAAMESFLAVTGKINVDPGNLAATDMADEEDSKEDPENPIINQSEDWSEQVALRVDAQLLEQVEALEDKVANASMQIKGWKLPPRAGTEEAEELEKLHEMEQYSAVEQARQRLLSLESAIERRYLKPPLGVCTGDPNLAALKAEQAAAAATASASANSSLNDSTSVPSPPEETTPRGLNNWREATARAHTSAQLAMSLYMLEASIAWDKSIMKANCQFCHSGDNEDKLLLCDGCDRGYHTYCFRPKMDNIPEGDWYCHECMNKATGERNCLVCGKRVGKNLVLCELCPRAYHTDCHNPVMPKIPRGKWYCSNCHSKQPKKKSSSRKSHSKGDKDKNATTRDSESSDHPPASPTPSTASNTHVDDVSSSEAPTPTASPRKEPTAAPSNKSSLTKKQQRELAPCKLLLEQLERQDEAWPFLLPVNTKQFPTYKKIIKVPMDLSTIKKKLQDCVYKTRDDFCTDVRQMFINCEVFNEDDSPVGKAGHGMRTFFETRWTEITGVPPPTSHPHS